MPLIRTHQKKEDVLLFDEFLDASLSTYDSHHLEHLFEAELRHFWFKSRRDKICQTFLKHVKNTDKILEVGGGTGFIAGALKNIGFSIEMSDIHFNGLLHAKKRGIENLYQFDLFNPPFQEEFDVICLFDVLEHLHEQQVALECIKKMLKPGGIIILTVPAHDWLWSQEDVIAGHRMRFTKKKLKTAFEDCHLEVVELRYFFWTILPLLMLRRLLKKDHGQPIEPNQSVDLKLNPFINHILYLMIKSERYLEKFTPNLAGGSLLGIARKVD